MLDEQNGNQSEGMEPELTISAIRRYRRRLMNLYSPYVNTRMQLEIYLAALQSLRLLVAEGTADAIYVSRRRICRSNERYRKAEVIVRVKAGNEQRLLLIIIIIR